MRTLAFAAALGLGVASPLVAAAQADTKTISAVEVEEQDGTTRILLRGVEDPIYTAFMREDPPRLIVELPDVVFSGVNTPIDVSNDTVREVTLGAFGDPRVALSMARVSVALEGESDYEIVPEGDTLVIAVRPASDPSQSGKLKAVAAPADDPGTSAAPADDAELPAAPTGETAAASDPEPAAEALSRLVAIEPTEGGIAIRAEGPIDNVDSFALEAPDRLVIDFFAVENAIWPARRELDSPTAHRARIGTHPDKVRVVLDLRAPIESHSVEPTPNGVIVAIAAAEPGPGETQGAAALPASPEPGAAEQDGGEPAAPATAAADPAPAADPSVSPALAAVLADSAADAEARAAKAAAPSGAAWVESVHFESLADTDRVVVSLSRPVAARTVSPDDDTLIVLLPGAKIAPETERRVDTAEFGGTVQMFSVFETPDVDYQEVRVVLKRSAPVGAELHWDDNQLRVEVTRAPQVWEGGGASGASALPGELAPANASGSAPETAGGPEAAAAAAALGSLGPDDPFLTGGPSDPAAIDILAEGGFTEEKEYTGRRISLDFKDADIGNILRLIAEVSDLNVIAGEEVQGKVTIRLVDVPWDQALDVILLTKGLGFVRVGNVLRIASLDTIKLENEARLQDRRAKEKLEDLVVKLQPVNYADVKEIKSLVKKLLSKRGTVNSDERTSTLIIKDIPSVVQEATALIKAIDTQTPQVLIESKIVEANLSFLRSLGTVWGMGYRPNGSGGGAPDLHLADATLPDNEFLNTNFFATNPILAAANGLFNLGVLGLDDHLELDLQIQAAESNNKGKVISSPRVVTLDNREAVIKQGVAIKFEASTGDKITISFIDAVLELKVTPHITANRSIIMDINISRNAPSISESTGDIVGINKNEANTQALIRDGETIVLGGIYVVDSGKSRSKTPFLADIPLLGAAFRSSVVQDVRRELLIFVTPRIIMGAPETTDL